MIWDHDLKGRIKKYTNYSNGKKVNEVEFDIEGREIVYASYTKGVIDYRKESTYTDICRSIIRNYEEGVFSGMTIIYTDLEDNIIFQEGYNPEMELQFRKEEGLRHKITDEEGRLLEVRITKEGGTHLLEKYEYNEKGYCARITKFDDKGQLIQIVTNAYDDNGRLIVWKLFARDLLPARVKKMSYDNEGRLTQCICIKTGKNAGKYDNPFDIEPFFDHDEYLDYDDYDDIDNSKYYAAHPLTEEKRALFPDIALVLDELCYDADGNDSGIVPSLGHFDHVITIKYDIHGNRTWTDKSVYWTEFHSERLTIEEYYKEVYDEHNLLIEESYCETKTDYDWGNETFYENQLDNAGRMIEKKAKSNRGELIGITTYAYDRDSARTETEEMRWQTTIRRFDSNGNQVYNETISENGEKKVDFLDIEYWDK